MTLIVLGFLVLVISGIVIKRSPELFRYKIIGRFVALLLIVTGILTSCIKQIDAGEVGVQKLFGKMQNEVLRSGLHFINPMMNVEKLDIKTQNYTMSGINDEGNKNGDDAIRVLTSDGLEVTIDLTVLYRVFPADAPKLLMETGNDYRDKIVRPITRTKIRDNAVYYQAVDFIREQKR